MTESMELTAVHLLCLQQSANHKQREEQREILGPVAVTANVFTDEKRTFIWHFDEGCGDIVREATASCNDGKFYGLGIQWTEGKLNKGLVFAGSNAHPQWINVPHSPDLNIQHVITMEAWVFAYTA